MYARVLDPCAFALQRKIEFSETLLIPLGTSTTWFADSCQYHLNSGPMQQPRLPSLGSHGSLYIRPVPELEIRVPDQAKREPDVVQFKTTKEKHVDGIVATLSELYQGRPVTSVRIGQGAGGVIRGWVPADAEVRHTLAEERAKRIVRGEDQVKEHLEHARRHETAAAWCDADLAKVPQGDRQAGTAARVDPRADADPATTTTVFISVVCLATDRAACCRPALIFGNLDL